jgi:hypothetical protein
MNLKENKHECDSVTLEVTFKLNIKERVDRLPHHG